MFYLEQFGGKNNVFFMFTNNLKLYADQFYALKDDNPDLNYCLKFYF